MANTKMTLKYSLYMKASFIPSISLVNMNKVAGSTDTSSKQEAAPCSGSRARMSPVQLQWSAERAAQHSVPGRGRWAQRAPPPQPREADTKVEASSKKHCH